MDTSCDIGDGRSRWFRGLPRPYQFFTVLKDDIYMYIIGSIMRFVRIDSKGNTKVKILKTFAHGFDGISALEGNLYREHVYAIAEKAYKPKVLICRFEKGRGENKVIAELRGIKTLEIRAMRFNKKDLIIILTGYPSFCLSIWKWTIEQELMMALCNEPSEFSDLLISPINECHWVEFGRQHMTFYDLQSFTKNDVIRTQIYLPQRMFTFEHADPMLGNKYAMKIVSACFSTKGELYALDDHYGLHLLNQEDKILNWMCSLGYTFLGVDITQIIPFGDCIAEVRKDGWILAYDPPEGSGKMNISQTFKLHSNIKRFIPMMGKKESFVAITEKDGFIQEVENGNPLEPICLPDIMLTNIVGVTFIEPKSDYCAVLTDKGKICVLDCESGEMIDEWKLPFRPTGISSHPVLPFVFCGAINGCLNVLDVRNLKKPKIIARKFLTKEPHPFFSKFAYVCQGRYCIVADTKHDRIFAMYGFPFEEFDYIDSAKLPGEIRHLNVPGCGKEDLRIQVMIYAKDKVEELCPAFVYNFNLNNERLTLTASQAIENPTRAICLAPMKRYLYTYLVEKKKLALTPFCDDNTWSVLQEPEQWIDSSFDLDVNRMFVHGDRLYTFGEDGYLMVHDAPEIPERRDMTMTLRTLYKVKTHNFIDGGIKDGIVSMDGSQVITLGKDGTFSRVRIMNQKLGEPQWKLLGYEKPKLIENQMKSYLIDQERFNSGKKPKGRIQGIRVQLQDMGPEDMDGLDTVPSTRFQSIAKVHRASSQKQKRQKKKKKTLPLPQPEKVEATPVLLIAHEEHGEHDNLSNNLRPNTVVGVGEKVEPIQGPINVEPIQGPINIEGETPIVVDTTEPPVPPVPERTDFEVEKTALASAAELKKEEIRKQMEEEREIARASFGSDEGQDEIDGITADDVKTIMEPKAAEAPVTAESKGQLVDPPENHLSKKPKSRRSKLQHLSKYKNVKSKVAEQIKEDRKSKKESVKSEPSTADFVVDEQKEVKPAGSVKDIKDIAVAEEAKVEEPQDQEGASPEEETGTEGDAEQTKQKRRPQKPKMGFAIKSERFSEYDDEEEKRESIPAVGVLGEGLLTDDTSKQPKKSFHPILLRVDDTGDQFQESQRLVRFSKMDHDLPEHNTDGPDDDGVFCVSHVVHKKELPAAEYWAMYEYVLYLRQYHPVAVALFQEFLSLTSSMRRLMTFNRKRQEMYQVEMMEFSLDEKIEETLEEKAVKYVQYCHVLMKARNKIRHSRINLFKKIIWESYEQKGLMFTGFKTRTIVTNYPLKPFEETFGSMIRQCKEERRLELRMEINEQEIFEVGNDIILDILKAELELVDPSSKHGQPKSPRSTVGPSSEFDDISSNGGDKDDDSRSGRFSDIGDGDRWKWKGNRKAQKKELNKSASREKLRSSKNKKQKSQNNPSTTEVGRPSSEAPSAAQVPRRQLGKKKKLSTNIDDSDIRQRIRKRRYQQKELSPPHSETSANESLLLEAEERRMKQKIAAQKRRKYGSVHAKRPHPPGAPEKTHRPASKGYSSSSDDKSSKSSSGRRKVEFGIKDGGNDLGSDEQSVTTEDDAMSHVSEVGITRGSIVRKLKEPRVHPTPFGVFGPRGYHRRHHHRRASGDAFILEEEEEEIRRKKSLIARKAKKKKEAEEARKRRKERQNLLEAEAAQMTEYSVESDEDRSEGEEEAFEEMKNWKLEKMDEVPRALYSSVSETFDGSALHDLMQMHGYKRSLYVYHQFDLVARHQLIRQMYFLMEEVYRMKQLFNKLFDDARYWKIATIKKMATRNMRIREIFYYLKLDLDILDETMDPKEDPLLIFSVSKNEIPIKRYLTAEQRRLEELFLAEARARKNTRMAKFRRRALRVMMDGKLETKREELLLRDVPRPAFMTYKDVMEYSLEEYLESIEYQRKCEELEIERAELIKELEAELYKLYRQNAFDFNGAELRVKELHLAKIQFHYNVVMEETKIQRILRLTRITDDCLQEEDRVNDMLSRLKDGMKSTEILISQLQVRKNECRTKIEELDEKEKELERRFRRDMGDVGQFFEYFVKNYKRRPKIPAKGLDKAEIYEYGLKALKSPNIRGFARENGDAAKAVALAVVEIEDPMLMPQGCPRNFWDRFNRVRRERLAVNFEVKALNLDMEHINEGLQECTEREEESAKAMAAILAIISHRTDLRNYFIYNTEFQFVSGKGSIEIDYWYLQSHEESFMTLSKSVEKLNNDIYVASELFIQDLKKSMILHRDIREMEWKFKVVQMALKDGHQLVHDVATSKPTKHLLRVLRLGVNLDTMYEDRINLVRYLQENSMKFQQMFVDSHNKVKRGYLHQQKVQERTNQGLQNWLKEQNKSTSLLKYIGIKDSPETRIKRYNERVNKFLVKGYMVRKMHQNFQTIDYLEGELTRCYKKSFPVL